MKRLICLLLVAGMLLCMTGCERGEPDPLEGLEKPQGSTEQSKDDALHLDSLQLEFVTGTRNLDAMMSLKKQLPALLTEALAQEKVFVEHLELSFGTSPSATADALVKGEKRNRYEGRKEKGKSPKTRGVGKVYLAHTVGAVERPRHIG